MSSSGVHVVLVCAFAVVCLGTVAYQYGVDPRGVDVPVATSVSSESLSGTKAASAFLSVVGESFYLGGERVYLSGVNQAWYHYAYDFGNNLGPSTLPTLESYLQRISAAGGNSIRIWLHISGQVSPQFDSTGHVVGLDLGNTLVEDMRAYLKKAESYNILVFFCLWNAAIMEPPVEGLLSVESKLRSYIDNALTPMVQALATERALGGWEIMNEPEGSMDMDTKVSTNPCFDGTNIHGGGWTGAKIPLENFLKFINWQVAAIHRADPKSLVTVGSWAMNAMLSGGGPGGFVVNHYCDECLVAAGGMSDGVLDFYQVHTYDWKGKYNAWDPFNDQTMAKYRPLMGSRPRPLVIGEFSSKRGAGRSIEEMYTYAYDAGYSGTWAWQAITDKGEGTDGMDVIARGINAVRDRPFVKIDLNQ
eukprot:GFYU01002423.1.p1 GENE.GFYU01002423.1~~GFYU01002423.1.p1  ORF type:complete len:436 (-),score=74.36 GFYU01002423.1:88-1341(-)